MPLDSVIRVRRLPGYKDRLRSYSVHIDGVSHGKLKDNETLEFPLAPGTHTVQIRISWTGSRMVTVDLQPGESIQMTTDPGVAVASIWKAFSRTGWVDLSVDQPPRE